MADFHLALSPREATWVPTLQHIPDNIILVQMVKLLTDTLTLIHKVCVEQS